MTLNPRYFHSNWQKRFAQFLNYVLNVSFLSMHSKIGCSWSGLPCLDFGMHKANFTISVLLCLKTKVVSLPAKYFGAAVIYCMNGNTH